MGPMSRRGGGRDVMIGSSSSQRTTSIVNHEGMYVCLSVLYLFCSFFYLMYVGSVRREDQRSAQRKKKSIDGG